MEWKYMLNWVRIDQPMKMREISRVEDKKPIVNNYWGNSLKTIITNLNGLRTSAKDGKYIAGSGKIGQAIWKDKLVRKTKP